MGGQREGLLSLELERMKQLKETDLFNSRSNQEYLK